MIGKRGPSELMSELITACQAETTLNDYVVYQFSTSLKYFIGVDDEAQPSATDLPFIAVRPGTPTPAQDKCSRQNSLYFSICILKDGYTTTGSLKTMNGLSILQEIYFRFEALVIAFFISKGYERSGRILDPNTEIKHPLFRVSGQIQVEENF